MLNTILAMLVIPVLENCTLHATPLSYCTCHTPLLLYMPHPSPTVHATPLSYCTCHTHLLLYMPPSLLLYMSHPLLLYMPYTHMYTHTHTHYSTYITTLHNTEEMQMSALNVPIFSVKWVHLNFGRYLMFHRSSW